MTAIDEINKSKNKKNPIKSNILLQNLELYVHLGCSQLEQLQIQKVVVDIKISFSQPPTACSTDQLADTFCYDKLTNQIKTALSSRQFRLLEYLGCEMYQLIKMNLPEGMLISIRITKNPNIPNLIRGVSFYYGDENPSYPF